MIQEEQQRNVLFTDEYRSLLSNDEMKMIQIIEKQKGRISKTKSQKRQRLIWVPLIMKNILKEDTEPIFVYNLFKMMKSYDDDQIERYNNYGIQDAGIGYFDSIVFDKQNQNIEFSLNTQSLGQMDMSYLIKLYKSYQNQQYYDLAIALQEYQEFSTYHLQFLVDKFSQMNYTQIQIDREFAQFEKTVKEWLNTNLENEIYEIVIGKIDIDKKTPILKKLIFSKNLLLFIGQDLQQTYDEISRQRNFDFLTNFLRKKNINGQNEMDYIIKLLKVSIKQLYEFEFDEEVQTLDGYIIPTKKTLKSFFYNIETGEITKDISSHFILLTHYSFEPKWIKYLIDKRVTKSNTDQNNKSKKDLKNKNKIDLNNQNDQSIFQQNMDENFEYICQKEYFLEKFNYTPSINNNEI